MGTLFRDAGAPAEARVADLLAQMSLEEKLAQLGCLWGSAFVRPGAFDEEAALALMPHGIGQIGLIGASTSAQPRESATLMNQIQRTVIERTRLGIPIFVHEEAAGGFCHRDGTVFPQALAQAATWDPDLVERLAGVIREQMRAVGARLALAPVMDVARDPRWGRVEESYGEDPLLVGTLTTAFVRGLQTSDLRAGVAAAGKHFLGYAHSDGGRNCGPVHLGPRELRDVYAEPFAAAIRDAGLAAIMNCYASVDGLPCAGSKAILTDLLRGELGFAGLVVSDYWAVDMLLNFHHVAANRGEAARLAIAAGLDTELPALDFYHEPLKGEVEAGRLAIAVVDQSVRRVLRFKFRLGLFEQPYVDAEDAPKHFQTAEQRTLARRAAAEAVVLLKNDGLLPLAPGLRRIALIGPGADDQRLLQGDYHYPSLLEGLYLDSDAVGEELSNNAPLAGGVYAAGPYYTPHVTPLAGLRRALEPQTVVTYAKGCEVLGEDRSGFDEAVAAARQAQVAVVVVAGKSGLLWPVTVGEGSDATSLDLTGAQEALIEAVAATGTPVVVVVLSGRVHTLGRVADLARALLWTAPLGEEGGAGLADVLTGACDASGRLPVSLPRAVGQVPLHSGKRAASYRAVLHEDYVDCQAGPLFPFGHGLSYTSFAYSDLRVEASSTTDPVTVSLTVSNTGERGGDEVVQLYVSDEVASVARPDQFLVGFSRLHLASKEARRLTFVVHPSRLAFFDAQMRFVVEPGTFSLRIGASSANIRLAQTVTLQGETAPYQQRQVVATRVAVRFVDQKVVR
jgi:beta-glucosidase